MQKKVFIKTFGCQMNEYDSNRIADSVKQIGFLKTNKMNRNLRIQGFASVSEKIDKKIVQIPLESKQSVQSMSFNINSKIGYENDFFTYQILKPIIYVLICELLVLPSFFAYHDFLEMIKNTSNNESVAIIANNFF